MSMRLIHAKSARASMENWRLSFGFSLYLFRPHRQPPTRAPTLEPIARRTGLGRVTRKENEGPIFKPASHFHASPHRKELERTGCRTGRYIFGSEFLSLTTTADADVALDERPVHRGCRTARSIRHWWLVSKVAHMR